MQRERSPHHKLLAACLQKAAYTAFVLHPHHTARAESERDDLSDERAIATKKAPARCRCRRRGFWCGRALRKKASDVPPG